jgi:hypothetical protein
VPDTANGGFLEYRDVVRGIVGGGDFFHIAPSKTVILYSKKIAKRLYSKPSGL